MLTFVTIISMSIDRILIIVNFIEIMFVEIKNEKFQIKDGQVVLTYLAKGDIGFIKEYQYIRLQQLIDNFAIPMSMQKIENV